MQSGGVSVVKGKLISIDSPVPKREDPKEKTKVNEHLAQVFNTSVESLLQPKKAEENPFVRQQILAEIQKMNQKLDIVIQLLSKKD